MPLFRKKPVVIEAIKWTGENDEMQAFLNNGYQDAAHGWIKGRYVEIGTLEGMMVASIGDWIIKGVKGEFYPCKPDIFEQTYESVETDRQARGENHAPLMKEAALHLTNWLDKDECECEGPGHQCGRTQVERCRDRLLDASPQPQQIPEGYKLVPIDPTDEMIEAGCALYDSSLRQRYKAMLEAAPQSKDK